MAKPPNPTASPVMRDLFRSTQVGWLLSEEPPSSAGSSTFPSLHRVPLVVVKLQFDLRQLDLTAPWPRAEQIFPIVQGENSVRPPPKTGLMIYCPFALHSEEETGQQRRDVPEEQLDGSQSCTAPKVWADS
jgi:hypothetical protein